LLFALMFSGCGKVTVEKAPAEDWLAAALGWSSYEAMEAGGPMLISVSDGDGADFVLAYPQAVAAGSMGDPVLTELRQVGAASAIGEGEAYAARLQTSLYAIQEAFRGAPLTQRFIDPSGRYLAALMPQGDAWYVGFVDMAKKSMFTTCQQLQNCGAFVNSRSAGELAEAMKANGWKAIAASQVPATLKTYFLYHMGWLKSAWFVRLSGVVANPILVPVGMFSVPDQILLPDAIQIDQ
jgi:hypothetical protein